MQHGPMTPTTKSATPTVRRVLESHGIKQAIAATITGLDQSTISRRFTGEIPWRLNELEALADKLGITLSTLLEGEAPK